MFEHMDIVEYIYKSVVEFSYKKTNRLYATRSGYSKLQTGDSASPNTYPNISESSGKRGKYMQTTQRVSPNSPVYCMDPGIHQTNIRSWETLVIST